MHVHGSSRPERARPVILWIKTESGHANPICLGSEDRDNVQRAYREETLVDVRVLSDHSGPWEPLFLYEEEYFYAILDWVGCC